MGNKVLGNFRTDRYKGFNDRQKHYLKNKY